MKAYLKIVAIATGSTFALLGIITFCYAISYIFTPSAAYQESFSFSKMTLNMHLAAWGTIILIALISAVAIILKQRKDIKDRDIPM